jgi:hypothetical protein
MTNHIFTYTFKDDYGTDYTLQFIPGHEDHLSSPTSVEFPFGSLDRSLILKSSFLDDIPLGVEQARTLEIEADLNSITGTLSGVNFGDVQKYILRGGASVMSEVNVLDNDGDPVPYYYRVPNRWRLLKGSTLVYDGFQDYTPSNELSMNATTKQCKLKITCVDIMTWFLKNTTIDQLTFCQRSDEYEMEYNYLIYYAHLK